MLEKRRNQHNNVLSTISQALEKLRVFSEIFPCNMLTKKAFGVIDPNLLKAFGVIDLNLLKALMDF